MENKRPYVNYAAKQQAQAAKQDPKPETVESVAANAPEAAPTAVPVTEKEEAPVTKKAEKIERIKDADEVTVKFVDTQLLNVRSTPDQYANNVIGQLKRDTKVNVIREVGEFSQIGTDRYVMTKYLI